MSTGWLLRGEPDVERHVDVRQEALGNSKGFTKLNILSNRV